MSKWFEPTLKRSWALLALAACLAASLACGSPKKKVTTEEVREGRDRELYAEGLRAMRKRRYEEGRLLLSTLIGSYDGSPLLPLAKLLIADSFYREGGASSLAQADVEYREWLQFFPQHPLADDVLLKIAQIHVRQIGPANLDNTEARRAERELLRLAREYPQSKLQPQVQEYLKFTREQLGMHSLGVARLYFKQQKYVAVKGRCESIIRNYPDFTYMDETLFLHGVSLTQLEDTPEAAKSFARIVREYPNSEWRDKAAEYLERFGVEVPPPAEGAEVKQVVRKGFIKRKFEEIFGPSASVTKEGIILKKDDTIDPEVEELLVSLGVRTDVITPESTITGQGKQIQTYGQRATNGQTEAARPTATESEPTPKRADEPTPKVVEPKKSKKSKAQPPR
ncbi:outer membrane protein assembly factor BamD [Chloracidobacterium thermophilum]|uniref:outer membrane protein assembly factor BamD n=1 Tax=Chloracidobacterium thermophilum TaxID=458033 RepID=UPI0007388711|nr:outer membrane protein assembly factor BamD [Chloracidobacterium thermophilum]